MDGDTSTPPADAARQRWEKRTEVPLLWLAGLFAIAYAVPVVAPESARWVRELCHGTEWFVWGAYACDYFVRLGLARQRWLFIRRHPFALIAVAVPMVQPLRLLRLVSALLLVGQRARLATQIRVTTYVAGACAGLLMFGSLAVLEVERGHPGSSIHSMGDAVWWAFTTMTTVGYGDTAPVTGPGRVLAVGLMLSGIALLGVVTANIAAWFIARFERDEAESERQTAAISALTEEVRQLRREVAELAARQPAGDLSSPER
ncbi:two pore domain potassium channel family protein [Streptomyces oryzae]|uniref:Two pore domain potassium channel family protein n=1 Tax=Streptomyces oryzae TaxID=1434886 RepID=A0ABS3XK86_9ACTN|nr:potassium channel family protein [Streptomyces oryzae]MBO8195806.1 two pore domain potassium channel family protein [Streptomyces oryzae]